MRLLAFVWTNVSAKWYNSLTLKERRNKMKMHNLDTTGWNEFPFEVEGVNYVSKVANNSPFMARIKFLPAGVFESMNSNAVADLVGTGLTREQIIAKLNDVNAEASHAVIELA